MNGQSMIKLFIIACLWCSAFAAPVDASLNEDKTDAAPSGQVQFVQIAINGRTLTGPNNTAERRDGRILVPVTAIARGLGDAVNVSVANRKITVFQQTGMTSEFDAGQGRVSENGALVLLVSNASELVFTPNLDELLLPIEITAALFDVSIRYDAAKNLVIVARGAVRSDPTTSVRTKSVGEIYRVDYEYGLNRYSNLSSNSLSLNAAGRLGDGRFSFSSNSTSTSVRNVSLRGATFALERPNGQRYLAGDFGTGANLEFLATTVRGGRAFVDRCCRQG